MPKHLSRWGAVLLAVAVLFIACRDRVHSGGTGRLLILLVFSTEGELRRGHHRVQRILLQSAVIAINRVHTPTI